PERVRPGAALRVEVGTHLLAAQALDGLGLRAEVEVGSGGQRVPAGMATCQAGQPHKQYGTAGDVLHDVLSSAGPHSRPYFFGLLQMIAAARICGTYSRVSLGSFFRRYRCQKSRFSLRQPPRSCAATLRSTLRNPCSPLL